MISFPLLKLYVHYEDAWWRNTLSLTNGTFAARIFRGQIAETAATWIIRGDYGRGAAAAATWIFRGDKSPAGTFNNSDAWHYDDPNPMAADDCLASRQLPFIIQGSYHDADVRCDGDNGQCRGYIQAAYFSPRGYVSDASRRRRGCTVDIPWRRVAATPRLKHGRSVETSAVTPRL